MNNRGSSEAGFIFLCILVILIEAICIRLGVWNWEVREGRKIQIGNAVYKCEKIQELDLK